MNFYWSMQVARDLVHLAKMRSQTIKMFGLIIAGTLAEFISIALVIPLVGLLINPTEQQNHWLNLGVLDLDLLRVAIVTIFIVAVLLAFLTRLAQLRMQSYYGQYLARNLNILIYSEVLENGFERFLEVNQDEFVSIISNKVNACATNFIQPILKLTSSLLFMVFALGLLLYQQWVLTLLLIVIFSALYGGVKLWSGSTLETQGIEVASGYRQVIGFCQELFSAYREIKLCSADKIYKDGFSRAETRLRDSQAIIQMTVNAPKLIVESAIMILVALVMGYLSISAEDVDQLMVDAAVLGIIAQRLLPQVHQIYQSYSTIKSASPVVSDLMEYLRFNFEDSSVRGKTIDDRSPNLIGKLDYLEVRDLGLALDPSSWLFRHVNQRFEVGKIYGLVGQSGSGKSSFLDVVCGLRSAQEGSICVSREREGGLSTEEDVYSLNIGYVQQQVALIEGTILDNIVFGRINPTFDYISRARKVWSVVTQDMTAPLPLAKIIGRSGSSLSGGQVQRIGIARALCSYPEVLILDEFTNSLDAEATLSILRSIGEYRSGCVTFVVSHIGSTLAFCDQILEIQKWKYEI